MKPQNVVICDSGAIKIIDLGQACAIGAVKERIQGTPDYIAPEQVHRRELTERTDVYNLGATLYWALTSRNIPTAIAKGDSLVGSLDDNLIEKPTPIRELAPQVPEQLADLIMQCVEVNPANRPQSMEQVADKLEFMLTRLRAEKQRLKGGSGVAMQALSREAAKTGQANETPS
jgi:serine/threonine-protein kinase